MGALPKSTAVSSLRHCTIVSMLPTLRRMARSAVGPSPAPRNPTPMSTGAPGKATSTSPATRSSAVRAIGSPKNVRTDPTWIGPGSRGGSPEMSRSRHTARLGSLASSRMMAESAGRGSRSEAASATVSAGVSEGATSACSGGGTSQAVSDRLHRRRAAEDGRDVMASITSGSGGDEQVSTRGEAHWAPSRGAIGKAHQRQHLDWDTTGRGARWPPPTGRREHRREAAHGPRSDSSPQARCSNRACYVLPNRTTSFAPYT